MVLDRKSRIYVSQKKLSKNVIRKLPRIFSRSLAKLTNEPYAWFQGQIIQQFIKFSNKLISNVESVMGEISFDEPIVGLHIRVTDIQNIQWRKNVSIETFMDRVRDYYDTMELTQKVKSRRVFVATDNHETIRTLIKKYPDYKIHFNYLNAKIAKDISRRFSLAGLFGIMKDFRTLLRCHHVICGYSSNICRLILEHRQAEFPDSTNLVESLDSIYFVTLNINRFGLAIESHKPIFNGEIELKKGDQIRIRSDQSRNGYYYGTNTARKTTGLMPSFKIQLNSLIGNNIYY